MESSSSSGSKRRRLMVSYVSLRPDIPATFESLNDDSKRLILQFVGNKSYATYAGINKHCKEVYLTTKGMTKETFVFGYASLSVIIDKIEEELKHEERGIDWELYERVGEGVLFYNRSDVMDWAVQERKDRVLQHGICDVAGEEGKLDLLEKVWNNLEDDADYKKIVFECVDDCAAYGGKLNVLKWLEDKGLCINGDECAKEAAYYGHLHILQWLQEEKGLQLHGELYECAIKGDHLNVMKWLREQEVDWDLDTFMNAAIEGNLNILQWLHDEGCPWPNDWRVSERSLKPEVIDWLRSNGYGDRI